MKLPIFTDSQIEALCSVLGHTDEGLRGSEIGNLLQHLGIADPYPSATKRIRLQHALSDRQVKDGCGNLVAAFIQEAMKPVRYHAMPGRFEERRSALNVILSFSGLSIGPDGSLVQVTTATTLSEAQARARTLERKLRERGVHPDLLMFCRAELLADNYFHSVFEATKSIAEKVRDRSGSTLDGAALFDFAFGGTTPLLAINTLSTETERAEQAGFLNLLKGMFGTFRHPPGHAPKIKWPIDETDALDLFSLASYLHRRIDGAANTRYT
jgi:uncharacterized protein (TIGR02391 family)